MSADGGWYVVKFTEESAYEAIPSNWLLNFETCVWPNFPPEARATLEHALKNRTSPESTWTVHKIKILLKKSFSKYQIASHMATKAVTNSDIDQDVSLPPKRKKRTKRASPSSSEEESDPEEECRLPDFPEVPGRQNILTAVGTVGASAEQNEFTDFDAALENEHDAEVENIPIQTLPDCSWTMSQPVNPTAGLSSGSTQARNEAHKADGSFQPKAKRSLFEVISSPPYKNQLTNSQQKVSRSSALPLNNNHERASPLITPNQANQPSPAASVLRSSNIEAKTEFERHVIRSLNSLSARLRDQSERLDLIFGELTKMNSATNDLHQNLDNNAIDGIVSTFPVDNEEALEMVETTLNDKDNFQKLVEFLASIGGRNPSEFIRRVMSRIISNEFASTFSWMGHKGKKPFNNLRLADALKSCVKKLNKTDNNMCSERDIELQAAKWLAKAGTRARMKKHD